MKYNKKKILILISLLLLALVVTSCQDNPQSNVDRVAVKSAPQEFSAKDKASSELRQNDKVEMDRKIIKEANLRIESKYLLKASDKIKELIEEYDGYISNSRQWQDASQRNHYYYTLKVPQKHFKKIILAIEELGELKNEQIKAKDITAEYIDLEARLKNLKAQEKRYLELLDKAENVEGILKIEKELNRVRTDIERIEGQLKYYNNKISFSTIDVTINEPRPVISTGWGFIQSFKQSIRSFLSSINAIIVLVGQLIPWLIFLFIFFFGIYKLVKKIRK
jgi:glucan-binding YG repeat protein